MEYTIIKPGYRITVESYENDGDYRATEVVENLTKNEAALALGIIKLFEGQFGNEYSLNTSQRKELADAAYEIMQKHEYAGYVFDLLEKDDEEFVDGMCDQVMDFVSNYGLCSGEQFSRGVNSIKVEFIPEEIKIKDVTAEFN